MESGRWCVECQQVWLLTVIEADDTEVRCPACGGATRPERRSGADRRTTGSLYRVWDPESRTGVDRRHAAGQSPA